MTASLLEDISKTNSQQDEIVARNCAAVAYSGGADTVSQTYYLVQFHLISS